MKVDRRSSVTLVRGDGVGPEVTEAVQSIMEAAGARITWDESVWLSWDSLSPVVVTQ